MRSAAVLLAALLTGCGLTGGQDCGAVGGVTGLDTTIDRSLWVAEGDVLFTVCDAEGCATATRHLDELTRGQGGGVAQERSAHASFGDLGREFDDGPVDVTVELRDAVGTPIARRQDEVRLERRWPNGKACDREEGYVSGVLDLRAEDRLAGRA